MHHCDFSNFARQLGNEQYNPMYPEQVANMEARAAKLGMAQTMFYMNPNNANWLKPDDAAKVEVCCNSSVLYR